MIYRFADCKVDTLRHELRRAGQVIKVEPKVFAVLAHLLQRRNHLVTRDALLDAFWPALDVYDASLSRCMSRVRRAIGHQRQRTLIETVYSHGYRFVGEVTVDAGAGQTRITVPGWLVAAGSGAGAVLHDH